MPAMINAVINALSFILLLVILHDAFEVMLLPRRVKSRLRLVQFFFRFTWAFWVKLSRILTAPKQQHNFMSLYGPLSMVLLLMLWAVGLVTCFGTLHWVSGLHHAGSRSWLDECYFSGVTFFTLGYGDIVPKTPIGKILSVVEAGIGMGFLATVIGYLPVLYQLFSRREAQVILLDAAAGSPPTAFTLLARHYESNGIDELKVLLKDWQRWCGDLLESQVSYPMLAYYRSQHDNQSWLASVAAIMDCCALMMTGLEDVPTLQARLTFSTARQVVIEMGRVFQVGPKPFAEDRLSAGGFRQLKKTMTEVGLVFLDSSEAEQTLAAFRSTYEPFLNGLATYLDLPLPCWLPDEDQLDNWQNSPRGRTAKQLVESMPSEQG